MSFFFFFFFSFLFFFFTPGQPRVTLSALLLKSPAESNDSSPEQTFYMVSISSPRISNVVRRTRPIILNFGWEVKRGEKRELSASFCLNTSFVYVFQAWDRNLLSILLQVVIKTKQTSTHTQKKKEYKIVAGMYGERRKMDIPPTCFSLTATVSISWLRPLCAVFPLYSFIYLSISFLFSRC